MSYIENVQVRAADSPSIDAFGRWRISNVVNLYSNKSLYSNSRNNDLMQSWTNGTGANTAYLSDESATQLNVGTANGEFSIRSSGYFPYIPGKSQSVTLTGVLAPQKANVVSRIGYFDDEDGMFFELDENNLKVVIRSSTSGTVVEDAVIQDNWNIDKLDGTGKSAVTLDVTKAQIFSIDFQWLGVGRVRFNFNIGGVCRCAHEFNHANLVDTVYCRTPNLPARYEIRNTGVSASATSMKEICLVIASESGSFSHAYNFGVGNGSTLRVIGDQTRTPILAVRLKSTFQSKVNRMSYIAQEFGVYATLKDTYFELVQAANPSSITATWNDVLTDESSAEYSTDISAVTAEKEYPLQQTYVPAGKANKEATSQLNALSQLSVGNILQQNIEGTVSDLFIVYATPLHADGAKVGASLFWLEIV